jgi:ribosomal protein S18 acetylase RimI-like enzyme
MDAARFRGDDDPLALHVAVRLHDTGSSLVVAVGTVVPDPLPWAPDRGPSWRIRGMATKYGFRGDGHGRRVLDALIAHASDHGGRYLWCHARIDALDFYRRAGLVTIGDRFDDGVAVHHSMWSEL